VSIQYVRSEVDFQRSQFRVRGDTVEIFPASYTSTVIRVEFFGDEIERICETDFVTGRAISELEHVAIFPASHYAVGSDKLEGALKAILSDMEKEVADLQSQGKLLEAQRLKQRTNYDVEMIREIGYCSGIENYSRYFDGRQVGQAPFTLLDYFPDDFIIFVDESHMTLPQLRAMYNGDRARKDNLVGYGFRLKSAYDNRPLKFEEFNEKIGQIICISATPNEYELNLSDNTVEQLIRPTGLLDPPVEVRKTAGQIDDLYAEILKTVADGGRVLVTTLTKKMSESLTEYLIEQKLKVRYMHSDIDTLERIDIINELRRGEIDVIVGINLLREGLDIPEVKLVAILDADKEGFLRSDTALIQTIGRTARNSEGRVIMYADVMTGSMKRAISETNRRRAIQQKYNEEHGITPKTIFKEIRENFEITKKADVTKDIAMKDIPAEIEKLKGLLKVFSAQMDYERCIEIRDTIAELKKKLR
ncbi:MAG: excinuclease ABC subunit B, partial [Clostridia bacterium]|nr:excinuclease ABC subunit B [Clostridia bacterium]